MHSSIELTLPSTAHSYQAANFNNAPSSITNYAFLSSPPKIKRKPQPIATRCSPPRSLPRALSRRRSSISGSPAFHSSFLSFTPTPTSETPHTPLLTSYGYSDSFATFPRRGSLPHVQEVPLARRVPSSPKRSHGAPKRSHHRSPSSPFSPPSPTRTRSRAKSTTTRTPSLTPPPPSTSKLSKIRSLANLRSLSPSPILPFPATSIRYTMTTPQIMTPKVTTKRAQRSATPARGSAAFTKYRPMPFIQQMQMIQFMEGGTLDSHIRRHHVHAGHSTAHTKFATSGKEDVAHGYSFTDERGMVWFDEEEEWEFTSLLPRKLPHHRTGIKRLLGKRRDEESGDEWEDFLEDEEKPDEDVDLETLLAREDDALRVRDDDLDSFGGALEGPWAQGRAGSSVLKLPKSKTKRRRKRADHTISSVPMSLPEQRLATTRPRKEVVALRNEFLATAFTPPARSTAKGSRTPNPFRLFPNTTPRGQSPTSLETGPLLHATSLVPALVVTQQTSSSSSIPETRLTVASSPAAARRLGIDSSTVVSLQPSADSTKKQTFKSLRGCFKSTKAN